MFSLEGKTTRFVLAEDGTVAAFDNLLNGHPYVSYRDSLWKLIYAIGERVECCVFAKGQTFIAEEKPNTLILRYDGLDTEEDGRLDVTMQIVLNMTDDLLLMHAELTNRDTRAEIMEISLSPVGGIASLDGHPQTDRLILPQDLGKFVENPYEADLGETGAVYRWHEQYHRDKNMLYPSGGCSMQWYDLCTKNEGIYVGSHDASLQTTCLHIERNVDNDTLKLCVNKYIMAKAGESWSCPPAAVGAHMGDWHSGAKLYRRWIEESGVWRAPERTQWMRDLKGWYRVILKQQYGHINFKYTDLPALYEEACAAGLNTLFLIGWEKYGFCHKRPIYEPADDLGGEEELRKAIAYIRSRGGHVIIYFSYFAIDYDTDFYRTGGGDQIVVKSIWNSPVLFGETHAAEGTYRKLCNQPKTQYGACQDTILWQKMLRSFADLAIGYGADGVVYDIGATAPVFCYATNHLHSKPYTACCSKAMHYAELRENIRRHGAENSILMEHHTDVFGQYMDIAQGSQMYRFQRFDPDALFELYRYTFPELGVSNRDMANDEKAYRTKVNLSMMYGFHFDMSVTRCNGRLSDVPHFVEYMDEKLIEIEKYKDFLYRGRFVDEEGFLLKGEGIRAKAYQAEDGRIAVVAWNTKADEPVEFSLLPAPVDKEDAHIGLRNVHYTTEGITASLAPESTGVYIL